MQWKEAQELLGTAIGLAYTGTGHWEARIASELLAFHVERERAMVAGARAGQLLVVDEHGRRFRIPGGDWVEVEREAPQRLLSALAGCRARGGQGLTTAELAEAGWPGESFVGDAGVNRAYVALSALRKLGLRDVLVRREGRVLLDPAQLCMVVDAETPLSATRT
jgi:hypothetical protein